MLDDVNICVYVCLCVFVPLYMPLLQFSRYRYVNMVE